MSASEWTPRPTTASTWDRTGPIWWSRDLGDGWMERRLSCTNPGATHPTDRSEDDEQA